MLQQRVSSLKERVPGLPEEHSETSLQQQELAKVCPVTHHHPPRMICFVSQSVPADVLLVARRSA